jgi:hypothetical protein
MKSSRAKQAQKAEPNDKPVTVAAQGSPKGRKKANK